MTNSKTPSVLKRSRFLCSSIVVYTCLERYFCSIFSYFQCFFLRNSDENSEQCFTLQPHPLLSFYWEQIETFGKELILTAQLSVCLPRGWVYFFLHVRTWKKNLPPQNLVMLLNALMQFWLLYYCIPLFLCRVLWRHTLFLNTVGI